MSAMNRRVAAQIASTVAVFVATLSIFIVALQAGG
ncbi:MAG: hypothetical protein FD127_3384 [Acidimicrobiaceae bacterium]|jgi:hypothetical protein|nr:MAG: hypothetical protein FD127_3384 [Acidimicrobiaceae bacterium]